MEITDVLGRTRTVEKAFPAGEWSCPFCGYGVDPSKPCRGRAAGYAADCAVEIHCQNPACSANPHVPAAWVREQEAKYEARKREEDLRKRSHEEAMKRGQEAKETRERVSREAVEEAEKRGACVSCALYSMRFGQAAKFTKHRGTCPRERR